VSSTLRTLVLGVGTEAISVYGIVAFVRARSLTSVRSEAFDPGDPG
jgi:hypothetical protein